MSYVKTKMFWSQQTSSRNRADDAQFQGRKADEHCSLMTEAERTGGSIDLGCGAGELLSQLVTRMEVDVGLDYSVEMLKSAERNLERSQVQLVSDDMFSYLPLSQHAVWMTTGAINQYLNESDIRKFLNLFLDNGAASSLFLFDCIDPIRYLLMPYGISYRPKPGREGRGVKPLLRPISFRFRRFFLGLKMALGFPKGPVWEIPNVGMGFAYKPSFWLNAAAMHSVQIEIVSSRFYEYRYHVILRKC